LKEKPKLSKLKKGNRESDASMNQDDVYNFDADIQNGKLINPRAVSNANSAVV
jgi:hypothetical protein